MEAGMLRGFLLEFHLTQRLGMDTRKHHSVHIPPAMCISEKREAQIWAKIYIESELVVLMDPPGKQPGQQCAGHCFLGSPGLGAGGCPSLPHPQHPRLFIAPSIIGRHVWMN